VSEVKGLTKTTVPLFKVIGLVFMLAPPILADFQAGLDAYKRGDYDTALKEFRPLAEQGEMVAQWSLGVMYERGRGVPQDSVQAYRWYTLAAAQGDDLAVKFQNLLEKSIPPDQIAEAQRLAKAWKPTGKVTKRGKL